MNSLKNSNLIKFAYKSKLKFPNLYKKFVNYFFFKGKKNIIKKQIDNVFNRLSKELEITPNLLLLLFFNRLKTYVEVKKLKKRKRNFLVPTPITRSRRTYLSLFWLYSSLSLNKSKVSFEKKLYDELLLILLKQSCTTIQFLEKNNTIAVESRVFLHYRW
jgi:ribosomal protein S7